MNRGSALLAVLWLSAALATIAFSLAHNVRSETERTSTALDSVRTYYLATGALERALLYIEWEGRRLPDGTPRYWAPGIPFLYFEFPAGQARVEIVPESSKLNINVAPPEELYRLLLALGTEPERAREITMGIADWRKPSPGPTSFDQYYLSLTPSFLARHASFEEIEELLLIKGMTAELFYGSYDHGPQGQLLRHGALRDCVTVYGSGAGFDANTVEPAVLAAIGLPPEAIASIVETRNQAPFRPEQWAALARQGTLFQRLRIGGGALTTLRATARLRLAGGTFSDARRSVAAMISRAPSDDGKPYHVIRWYDQVWVQ